MNYRLYTFVANHYLSPLQCGLQTAHVVSELSQFHPNVKQGEAFNRWARNDKTIIICGAGNHRGVVDCYSELDRLASALALPYGIFYEDEQSMNGMATACGVIVPQKYWDVFFESHADNGLEDRWVYSEKNEQGIATSVKTYSPLYPEGQFIAHIKKYRLA